MSNVRIYPTSNQLKKNESLSKDSNCYGIDLGTTTTIMCYIDSSSVNLNDSTELQVSFVKVPQRSPFEYHQTIESEKVASIVGIHNGKPYVGTNLYHLKGHPDFEYKKNIFYHWKLELGIDHHPMYPDAINEKLNMPYKIASGIMNYIRRERFGEQQLYNTIITVPASFQANQRKDVLKAAEMASVETAENMLIDEPNAAFLGYFNRLPFDEKQAWAKSVKNKNVLIVDFGGGTLDLSILNIDFRGDTGITISNRAISRYNDLGGQDIDTLIAEEYLVPKFKEVFDGFDTASSKDITDVIIPQLALIGEGLKVGISNAVSLKVADQDVKDVDIKEVSYTLTDCTIKYKNTEYDLGDISISATEFQKYFSKVFSGKQYKFKYIDKTISTISSSISDIIEKAQMGLDEIHYILFVGGSSFNPFLHSLCKEKLTVSQSLTSHEPDKLVAEGAAVYSYFLNVHNLSLIRPITSENIGVILKGDRFFPILERGNALPQKVSIPDFKLQRNLSNKVIVPVCINGVDFPIGEIRSTLNKHYEFESVVKIEAEVTIDKVFKMQVYIDNELIGNAEFENPYGMGKLTEEEREVFMQKEKVNKAKMSKNINEEKTELRSLIFKYYDVKNYQGVIDTAEEYIKRFDDLDEDVWNILYIAYDRVGRKEAAMNALKRAIEIDPNDPSLNYNYSILLENENSSKEALSYLETLNDEIRNDLLVRCRIIGLKNTVNENVREDAEKIVAEYKSSPGKFRDFIKKILLPQIFRIAEEPYAYVDPKTERKAEDQQGYLDTNNTPF